MDRFDILESWKVDQFNYLGVGGGGVRCGSECIMENFRVRSSLVDKKNTKEILIKHAF